MVLSAISNSRKADSDRYDRPADEYLPLNCHPIRSLHSAGRQPDPERNSLRVEAGLSNANEHKEEFAAKTGQGADRSVANRRGHAWDDPIMSRIAEKG